MKTSVKLVPKNKPSLKVTLFKYAVITSITAAIGAGLFFIYTSLMNNDKATAGDNKVSESDMRHEIIAEGSFLKVEKLPGSINTPYKEVNPIVSEDGRTIYFGRQKHPDNMGGQFDYEDIWCATFSRANNEWSEPFNNLGPLNNEGPNFICAVIQEGSQRKALVGNVYGKKGKMFNGVSYAYQYGSIWSEPEAMKIKEFYNLSPKADYNITYNGKVLIMSLLREDTYGERDLYASFHLGENKWSSPVNMGVVINSDKEDFSASVSKDGKYLYFSSTGHDGLGGSDIFVSKRLDDSWTHWTKPQNLGSMINTPDDEDYFHLPLGEGKYAYFTRGHQERDMDIMRAEVDTELIPSIYASTK